MATDPGIEALRASVAVLAEHGVVPAAAAALDAGPVGERLLNAVVDAVPAYIETGNPEVLPELREHLDRQAAEVVRLLSGRRPRPLDFVARHAERRASQRFPLEALLHTYRAAHRVLAAWIRDAALTVADPGAQVRRVVAAAADFAIEYTDAVSTSATSAYVERTRALAEAEGDRRSALLNLLLLGYDESDGRAAQILRRAGYLAQRQSYCVIAARSADPAEMTSPARAQRMVEAIAGVLGDAPVRSLIGLRETQVVAVVSATRRQSGWTAPQARLAERVYPLLRRVGPAAMIGMSNDVPSTSHVPRAFREAGLALDFASFGERVVRYSQIPLRRLLVARARDSIQGALPVWLDELIRADKRAGGILVATLNAYADGNMNAQQAARGLGVHPNTIYSRAQRIADITGRNMLAYHELTELLLALDCRE